MYSKVPSVGKKRFGEIGTDSKVRGSPVRRFRYHEVEIRVCSADADTLDWLEGLLAPSFDTRAAVPAWNDEVAGAAPSREYEVRYGVDGRRFAQLRRDVGERSKGVRSCFVLDTEIVRLPAVEHDGRTWLVDEVHGCVLGVGTESIEIVADPAAERRRLPLLRTVREIAAEGWRRHAGHLQLHAAAFAVGGAVIALAGAKNAGKTTALVHALGVPGARLVANDRVSARLERDRVVVRGMPTIVSIRSGTLARFPKLLHAMPPLPYPWSSSDAEWREARRAGGAAPKREPLRLSPARFAAQVGCHLARGGRLEAILVCSLDPELATRTLTRLPPDRARSALAACLYARGVRRDGPTIVETLVRGAVLEDEAAALDGLVARVPVFAYRLGEDAYDEPFDLGRVVASRDRHAPDLESALSEVAGRLGAGVVETSPLLSAGETVPRVYRATLADGRVVKARRIEDDVDGAMVARILAALNDPAFARVLLARDGALIEEWIDGVPLPDPPGGDVLAQAGDLLGRLHALERLDGVPVHGMVPTTRDLWRIEHDLEIVVRAGALGEAIGRRLLAAAVDCDPGETPVGVCHRDFCGENMVLDRHGRLRVVDNERMLVAPLDFDLERTAYRWGLAAAAWAAFLRAYRVHREPPAKDDVAFFWRLRAVTLSASFRVERGAASAAIPLAELRKLYVGAEARGGRSVRR